MENSEVNDYLDTLDETVEGTVDESVGSLLGEESGIFVEEVVVPQAPVVTGFGGKPAPVQPPQNEL